MSDIPLLQVRFLVLKNLAAVLAEEDGSAGEALALYGEAAALDGGDIVLWNRMGTLARSEALILRPEVLPSMQSWDATATADSSDNAMILKAAHVQ